MRTGTRWLSSCSIIVALVCLPGTAVLANPRVLETTGNGKVESSRLVVDVTAWSNWKPVLDSVANSARLRDNDIFFQCGVPGEERIALLDDYFQPLSPEAATTFWKTNGAGGPLLVAFNEGLGKMLGYSEGSRRSYIRTAGVDPLDLAYLRLPPQAPQMTSWFAWRRTGALNFLGHLLANYKSANPMSPMVAMVPADWNSSTAYQKAMELADWPAWAKNWSC